MTNFPLWKKLIVFTVCILGTIFAIPSLLNESQRAQLPSWFPKETVSLGLDLQGGSHLLLEVDLVSAFKDRLNNLSDETRTLLRKDRLKYKNMKLEPMGISFELIEADQKELVLKILKDYSGEIAVEIDSSLKVTRTYTPAAYDKWRKATLSQSRHIVENRINELGTKEPNIQTQGDNRIIVQLPGVNDPGQAKAILGKTAKLTFRLVDGEYPTLAASGGRVLPGTEVMDMDESQREEGQEPVKYLVKKQVLLTGENLSDAQVSFHHQNGEPQVAIRFDNIGARKFGEITKNNVGSMLAIILDDKVISAPRLNEPILGGNAVISGRFSVQEASNLALLMRAGSLPAPIMVIEERTVGPDLGADSIAAGENATIVSIILVVGFMILAYAMFGIFANIALFFNFVLLISALAITGSTLTMHGIAGIALTLGTAVDANVLIYERIKEELRLGRRIMQAVDAGYQRAMATIVDSNLTTLFGALALYFFGSGPIRAFGVTLTMGIVISMFTAITLTRMIAVWWIRWRKPTELSI